MLRKTLLLFLIVLALSCGNTSKDGQAADAFAKAQKAYTEKDYDQAVDLYEKALEEALETQNTNGDLLFNIHFGAAKANFYSKRHNRFYNARQHLDKALALKPDNGETLFYMGMIYQILGDGSVDMHIHAKAMEYLEKASRVLPKSALVHVKLGIAYDRLHRYEDGLKALEKAKDLDPESLEIRKDLGASYFLNQKYKEAEAEYLGILEVKPDYPMVHFNIGWLYLKAEDEEFRDLDKAIQYGEQALVLNPEYIPSYELLATAYDAKEEYRKALELVEDALKLKPEDAGRYFQMRLSLDAKIRKKEGKKSEGKGPGEEKEEDK